MSVQLHHSKEKLPHMTQAKPIIASPPAPHYEQSGLAQWLCISASTEKFKHALCSQLCMGYFTQHGGFPVYSHCTLDHYDRQKCSIIHTQHSWLTHSSVDVYLACFPTWVPVNSFIVNICIHTVPKLLFLVILYKYTEVGFQESHFCFTLLISLYYLSQQLDKITFIIISWGHRLQFLHTLINTL